MEPLTGREIRRRFLDFFAEKHHLIIPGAPLVPINDPTLLFINSGMAPLKKYFLGLEQPPSKRLVNYQACIRTRDIDDVGDRHHMTMFEMLGSWSIGDYYKQMAAELAWELLVDRFGFYPEKLFFTVFAGNPELGLPPDEESAKAWQSVGVPRERIVFLGQDNFWGPAGDTGPCGPCTEVFFDTGSEFGADYVPGGEFDSAKRYIEIWNAGVFMEFNKNADGTFVPLPLKSVDTGSGLERMEFVMNGYKSVYEIASLRPILDLVRTRFRGKNFSDKHYRTLVDHLRAATFITSEKVKPSNEGQGYIPRRLLRKCIAIGLRADKPSADFVETIRLIVDLHKEAYPHLAKGLPFVLEALQTEVQDFEPVISKGMTLIDKKLSELGSGKPVPADFLFEMVATHGVPLDLIKDHALDRGHSIDEDGYEVLFERHKNVSRKEKRFGGASQGSGVSDTIRALGAELGETVFQGYETVESQSRILKLVKGDQIVSQLSEGEEGLLIAKETPFYAESGGQVGDSGVIESDGCRLSVLNTFKEGKVFVHEVKVEQGQVKMDHTIRLIVDQERRLRIRANHSATHLMHSALREVLGPQAVQKGSHVDENRLRFDFQHGAAMSADEIREVELRVNRWIRRNTLAQTELMNIQSAIASGAIAMFGEKYEDRVRVVNLGPNAVELCGGTHVKSTGDIGCFFILSESSVAKGIRRIEAVTGDAALELYQTRTRVLHELSSTLSTNISNLTAEVAKLKSSKVKEVRPTKGLSVQSESVRVSKKGLKIWTAKVTGTVQEVRDHLFNQVAPGAAQIAVGVGLEDSRVNVFVAVEKAAAQGVPANLLLNKLIPLIDGKGGGKPTYAQGAGPKSSAIEQVIEHVPAAVHDLEQMKI